MAYKSTDQPAAPTFSSALLLPFLAFWTMAWMAAATCDRGCGQAKERMSVAAGIEHHATPQGQQL